MKKLATLTRITKEVLESSPETRGDDGKLVVEVFERLGISSKHPLTYFVRTGYFSFIRSIIRARGRLQQEFAHLCNPEAEARRKAREHKFRAYARSHMDEILLDEHTEGGAH